MAEYLPELIAGALSLLYLFGIVAAINALLTARTPQGAIAWSLFLILFPVLGLPIYLIFGDRKFSGYVNARRNDNLPLQRALQEAVAELPSTIVAEFSPEESDYVVFEKLAYMPFLAHNHGRLLINGEETFEAIFNGIKIAREYLLVQFFIVKEDELGRKLQQALIAKAKQGIKVYFLYDAVGSHALSSSYIKEMKAAGIKASPFSGSSHGGGHIFRINFRNHRKIVVVDGHTAYVGGLNVGDEYMGRDPKFSPWRDTAVKLEGPVVIQLQATILADWYWATRQIPQLNWQPEAADGDYVKAMIVPFAPSQRHETASLFFVTALNSAQERIWLSAPYFVPDEAVIKALELAALRGVDVRIITTGTPDSWPVYLAAFSYIDYLRDMGIRIYSYEPGFLHEKVMLIDDDYSTVGTPNFDNRSFRLNFEVTSLIVDKAFNKEMEVMFEADFAHAVPINADDLEKKPFWWRLAVSISRLASPVL